MNKIQNLYEKMSKVVEENGGKGENGVVVFCLLKDADMDAVIVNASDRDIFEALSMYLIDNPNKIPAVREAVNCANDYYMSKSIKSKGDA